MTALVATTPKEDRVNIVAIKQALADALGERSAEYWDILRNFIVAKLSKLELDLFARNLLGDSKCQSSE